MRREWWDEEDYAESHGQEPFAKLINEVAFFLSVGRDFVIALRERDRGRYSVRHSRTKQFEKPAVPYHGAS